MSYDPNSFLRLVAEIFLGLRTPAEADIEKMVDNLLDLPRFRRELTDEAIEKLEKRPRALAEKLLRYKLLNLKEEDNVQNAARATLAKINFAKENAPPPPLAPVEPSIGLLNKTERRIGRLAGVRTHFVVRADPSVTDEYGIALPPDLFGYMTAHINTYYLAELGSVRFARVVGPLKRLGPEEVAVSPNGFLADLVNKGGLTTMTRLRLVTNLPVAAAMRLESNAPDRTATTHDEFQEQVATLPGVAVGQIFRLSDGVQLGVVGITDAESGEEVAFAKMPTMEGNVSYTVDGRKRTETVNRCAGCHRTGVARVVEETPVGRRFCDAVCRSIFHL